MSIPPDAPDEQAEALRATVHEMLRIGFAELLDNPEPTLKATFSAIMDGTGSATFDTAAEAESAHDAATLALDAIHGHIGRDYGWRFLTQRVEDGDVHVLAVARIDSAEWDPVAPLARELMGLDADGGS